MISLPRPLRSKELLDLVADLDRQVQLAREKAKRDGRKLPVTPSFGLQWDYDKDGNPHWKLVPPSFCGMVEQPGDDVKEAV